jgi:hypothetical protein
MNASETRYVAGFFLPEAPHFPFHHARMSSAA